MDDLISRQAAIDAVDIGNLHRGIVDALQNIISELPSAQPEPDTRLYSDGFDDGYKQAIKDAQPEIIRRPVVGYEGYYEVDNCGRVYALDRVIHVSLCLVESLNNICTPKGIKLFHSQEMERQKTFSFTE